MREKLESIAAHLLLIAKEMGQLEDCPRRNKLIKELKTISENIHAYKVDDLKRQRKEQ